MERLVTRMDRRVRWLAGVGALLIVWTTMVPAQSTPEVVFRQAAETETVKGDLKAAIAQYQRVVETAGANRALVAQALVRMADCYQKLGDAEARKVYERLVRDFSDQAEPVRIARARLTGSVAPTSTLLRRIWSGPDVSPEGRVSPDGRYVSYPAWTTGDLGLYEVASGTTRLLTNHNYANDEFAEGSVFSRDSRQLAYAWYDGRGSYELRVVPVQQSGIPESRTILSNPEISFAVPRDWTPDHRTILAELFRKDQTVQLALVAVSDGSIRALKTLDWRGTTGAFLSPDGRFVGYDVGVSERDSLERDVFVLALDGSRDTPVVVNPGEDVMMGWSPDGTHLLFGSDRTGSPGLWSQPMRDSRSEGSPVLVKPETPTDSLGVTASGALYLMGFIGGRDVRVATVDLASAAVLQPPASVVHRFVGFSTAPDWSPDGKLLAYASARRGPGRNRVLVVRTLETGQTRDLPLPLGYFNYAAWMADSRSLLVRATDFKGRQGAFKIDTESGAATLLVAPLPCANEPQLSPDESKLYYFREGHCSGNAGAVYVERTIATGTERVVFRGPGPARPVISPDGRYLAGVEVDKGPIRQPVRLVLLPIDGGPPREIMRADVGRGGPFNINVTWTPDGRALLVPRRPANRPHDVLIVPIDGTAPRVLNLDLQDLAGSVKMHPDGRQIAFSAGLLQSEVWVMENFLR